MGEQANQPRMLDGIYELVGKEVAPFDVSVSDEAVLKLYGFLKQSLLPMAFEATPVKEPRPRPVSYDLDEKLPNPPQTVIPQLSTTHTVLQFSHRIAPHRLTAPDLDAIMFSTIRLTDLPDQSWKLRTGWSRLKYDGSRNRFGTFHSIDVVGGQIMQAKRRVKVLKGNMDADLHELIDEQEVLPTPPQEPQSRHIRKAFEVPITDQHCEQLHQHLASLVSRHAGLST